MKKIALLVALTAVFFFAIDADAAHNYNGKFQLHFAGTHNAKTNTCAVAFPVCTGLVVSAGTVVAPWDYDVYLIAIDVAGIAGARYGITCNGPVFWTAWANCADLEIADAGWPGCGKNNAQTFFVEEPGPHVVLGIFQLYLYVGTNSISTTTDSRVGFAEFCDQTQPSPICDRTTNPLAFSTLGFNGTVGVNRCSIIPVQQSTWAQVKALYR